MSCVGVLFKLLTLASIPLWTAQLFAQQGSCTVREVPVSVEGRDGTPVTDLTAEDFHAEFQGKAVMITSAVFETAPRRVILALDASGSMTSLMPRWKSVIASAKYFTNALPPSDSITLIPFAAGTGGPFRGRKQVLTILDQYESRDWQRLKGRRPTALIDAIKTAAEILKPAQFGDSILVITDGDDNASMENEVDLERFVLSSGIRVFGFVPGLSSYSKDYFIKPPLIMEITDLTGGEWMTIDAGHEDKIAERMRRELAGFYRVKLSLPEPVIKDRTWKLTITPHTPGRGKLLVRVPKRLARCS